MAATLSDVAARAGVSVSAASRVLANSASSRVRPETRERIEKAAKDLGYRPNFAGRALKLARSNVIALIVPDLTNAIFTELMRGVEDAAVEHDYVVLLGRSEGMQPGGGTIAKLIGEGRVDGLLVQLAENLAQEDVELLGESTAPVVFINSRHDGAHSSVSLPDAAGARVATEHLLSLGHRRIALLAGVHEPGKSLDRERGFRDAMADAGVPIDERLVTTLGYSAEQGRQAFRRVWALSEHPTAVFAANLNAAIGALAEARALGVRVPEDLSIVGLHDAWTAENTWPALTTVRMPLYELGHAAIELMIARLTGAVRQDVRVDDPAPLLIPRESTAPPA
jgi:LacI family transcriptional regulator